MSEGGRIKSQREDHIHLLLVGFLARKDPRNSSCGILKKEYLLTR